jgi:hypothetical protein
MAEKESTGLLKVALMVYAVVALIYGIGFLIFPGVWVRMSQGAPVDFGWLRWSGGVIIAFGIGALMVFRKPEKQGFYVFATALATLLSGIGMLISMIFREYSGTTMFIVTPIVLMFVISGLLWWGRQRAKAIL